MARYWPRPKNFVKSLASFPFPSDTASLLQNRRFRRSSIFRNSPTSRDYTGTRRSQASPESRTQTVRVRRFLAAKPGNKRRLAIERNRTETTEERRQPVTLRNNLLDSTSYLVHPPKPLGLVKRRQSRDRMPVFPLNLPIEPRRNRVPRLGGLRGRMKRTQILRKRGDTATDARKRRREGEKRVCSRCIGHIVRQHFGADIRGETARARTRSAPQYQHGPLLANPANFLHPDLIVALRRVYRQ